jgi:hypothetical protein
VLGGQPPVLKCTSWRMSEARAAAQEQKSFDELVERLAAQLV